MTILMIVIGVILLLPGVCAAAFVVGFTLSEPRMLQDLNLILLWLVCFAGAFGGIMLIRHAWRRRSA